jgi:hypothetical protein
MMTIQEKLDEVNMRLRTYEMPASLAQRVEAGLEAQREADRQKTKWMKERDELIEAQRQQISADQYLARKAAREREEALDAAARKALADALSADNDAFDDIVRGLRIAAEGMARRLGTLGDVRKAAAALTNGRAPDEASQLEAEKAMSLLALASLKAGVVNRKDRHRLGVLEFQAAADARFPPGHDWQAAEKQRLERALGPLCRG